MHDLGDASSGIYLPQCFPGGHSCSNCSNCQERLKQASENSTLHCIQCIDASAKTFQTVNGSAS